MNALATTLIIFILSCRVALAQNVIISSGIPEPKSDVLKEVLEYVSQMKGVERSLVSGSLKTSLKFSKEFTRNDSAFKKFSDRFKEVVPANFFTHEGRPRLLTGEMGNQKNPRVQWTYASIESDTVVKYAELVVNFEIHKRNKTPTVRNIELRTEGIKTLLTDEEIIELHERAKSVKVILPTPPPIKN